MLLRLIIASLLAVQVFAQSDGNPHVSIEIKRKDKKPTPTKGILLKVHDTKLKHSDENYLFKNVHKTSLG